MDAHDHRTRILSLLHLERNEIETALGHLYRQRLLPELRNERDRLITALAKTREHLEKAETHRRRKKNTP